MKEIISAAGALPAAVTAWCVGQYPGHRTYERPSIPAMCPPRCWSGTNRISWSGANVRITFSALPLVTHMSHSAFTSAVEFT